MLYTLFEAQRSSAARSVGAMAAAMMGVNFQLAQNGHVSWMDDDQLHVILVGTGCPMFDPTRSGP